MVVTGQEQPFRSLRTSASFLADPMSVLVLAHKRRQVWSGASGGHGEDHLGRLPSRAGQGHPFSSPFPTPSTRPTAAQELTEIRFITPSVMLCALPPSSSSSSPRNDMDTWLPSRVIAIIAAPPYMFAPLPERRFPPKKSRAKSLSSLFPTFPPQARPCKPDQAAEGDGNVMRVPPLGDGSFIGSHVAWS